MKSKKIVFLDNILAVSYVVALLLFLFSFISVKWDGIPISNIRGTAFILGNSFVEQIKDTDQLDTSLLANKDLEKSFILNQLANLLAPNLLIILPFIFLLFGILFSFLKNKFMGYIQITIAGVSVLLMLLFGLKFYKQITKLTYAEVNYILGKPMLECSLDYSYYLLVILLLFITIMLIIVQIFQNNQQKKY